MIVRDDWPDSDRIAVATVLLGIIQGDIPAGQYGEIGRPNIQSVLYVLHEPAEVLNQFISTLRLVVESAGGQLLVKGKSG
jgi:hypothetical protein